MSKIKDTYRYSILIKCPKGERIEYSNRIAIIKEQDRNNRNKNFTAVVDINPYSFT
jgi:primosomal protein N'